MRSVSPRIQRSQRVAPLLFVSLSAIHIIGAFQIHNRHSLCYSFNGRSTKNHMETSIIRPSRRRRDTLHQLFSSNNKREKNDTDLINGDKTPKVRGLPFKKSKKNKEELMKAVGEEMRKQHRESEEESSQRLLDQINPFKAGQSLRRTIDNVFFRREDDLLRHSKYYLTDDNVDMKDDDMDDSYVPEVLVVGATGATGQLIVRQLLLRKCRVRVLVRDLYTQTLNKLGTSVTYCQGDLLRPDTLEYATTDVDKIVFCAGANSETSTSFAAIDEIGVKNLIHAYQNVRHADYGTQQAAKRSLFQFRNRIKDFYLFDVTEESTKAQWLRNDFESGVFYGQGPAYLKSSRLRSRDEPSLGIDFGPSFAGFVCRVCSDGQSYEAVCQSGEYEYTCQFSTRSKSSSQNSNNKSRIKFTTLRLPFENFTCRSSDSAPRFDGTDLRHIGFRFNSKGKKFYLAMDYIKLFRSQPEPEFVYVSDARIPRVVKNSMIQVEAKQLAIHNEIRLYDDQEVRSPEATFYKFVGEEIVKKSGLSYAIIRVNGLLDGAADASAISLLDTPPTSDAPVSRADVAQICVHALLDPAALNKSFYVTPSKRPTTDDISRKLALLPVDEVA